MPLAPGETFERYAIHALVGRGGMGEVYRATDTRLHRDVALKVLRSDKDVNDATTTGGVQRLLREARAAAAFNHANSVAIYELGEAEGIPYIAMEYVVGSSLRAFVGDRTVTLETKVSWLVDVARALFAAHKAGLVHRDVKPGNIMVSDEGVVKVLDFGLAKPTKKDDPQGFQTLMGQVLGTPRYMAPEQLEGVAADARSDQFSFGVVAYELLTGVFPGGPLAGSPQPLETHEPAVPQRLSIAVRRMMSRDPKARFSAMDDAANALRECLPSLRNLAVPPSGDHPRRRPTSDAPTTEQRAEQAHERSGAIAIDAPIPADMSTQPIPAAVGAEVSRRVAAMAMNQAPSMRTIPLAQQTPLVPLPAPSTPRSTGGAHAPITSSGQRPPYSVPPAAVAPPAPSSSPTLAEAPHRTGPFPPAGTPIVAPRGQRPSSTGVVTTAMAIAVVLAAIVAGAAFALMHR